MPEPPVEGQSTAPRVSHANPVTQAGFAMIPMAVMLRQDIRPASKLVYAYLSHLAWRNSHADAVDPLLAEVATGLGISDDAVRSAIRQLSEAPVAEGADPRVPRLLVSRRRGLGLPNYYILNDPGIPDLCHGCYALIAEQTR